MTYLQTETVHKQTVLNPRWGNSEKIKLAQADLIRKLLQLEPKRRGKILLTNPNLRWANCCFRFFSFWAGWDSHNKSELVYPNGRNRGTDKRSVAKGDGYTNWTGKTGMRKSPPSIKISQETALLFGKKHAQNFLILSFSESKDVFLRLVSQIQNARMAKWNTRRIQNPFLERGCEFESHFSHQNLQSGWIYAFGKFFWSHRNSWHRRENFRLVAKRSLSIAGLSVYAPERGQNGPWKNGDSRIISQRWRKISPHARNSRDHVAWSKSSNPWCCAARHSNNGVWKIAHRFD